MLPRAEMPRQVRLRFSAAPSLREPAVAAGAPGFSVAQTFSTKLSSTRFSPALSNCTVSLLPSMPVISP